ncbi:MULTISPECIES: hypothetical protein [unclassified Acinetobacter]|uniref:hypothetical protein n=1 Tax=unclassified Acinetobacter TaxID=196816 RepID=UPI00244A033F|nr:MULTISPECIES: hypothetical protein [unclassified Acinetobacter]MDH0032133.1 hypothetical protein [Acinetobacter sp. GD04021]MDH0887850.1 hypothetical protein [Acinetobacter sp. GD03873]MDH1081908.1 hypothetical protein [Acinetobacter sp. GD03983]MDH2191166.1 hypothetical protein [Acinetobacter sp. GD03645]MDH2204649.1 hypothetical protein [Acinetobacter sp. GD03647]
MNKIRMLIFLILIVVLIFFSWIKFNQDKFLLSASVDGDNLIFNLSKNKIHVFGYEINNLEEMDESGVYKNIYEFRDLNKEIKKIKVVNYKEKNILPNHAYYFSFSHAGGKGESGVVLKYFNFCVKNQSIISKVDVSDRDFIDECHKEN